MKWRIIIVIGCLAAWVSAAELPVSPSSPAMAAPAEPVAAATPSDVSAAQLAVSAAAAIPAEVVPTPEALELQKAQSALKAKDALIERLSQHLESALARLNQAASPLEAPNSSLAAMTALKAKLEEQNNLLKARQDELQGKLDEISRKSQLLDLENRQLFEALNGRPYLDRELVKPAKNDKVLPEGRRLAKEE